MFNHCILTTLKDSTELWSSCECSNPRHLILEKSSAWYTVWLKSKSRVSSSIVWIFWTVESSSNIQLKVNRFHGPATLCHPASSFFWSFSSCHFDKLKPGLALPQILQSVKKAQQNVQSAKQSFCWMSQKSDKNWVFTWKNLPSLNLWKMGLLEINR